MSFASISASLHKIGNPSYVPQLKRYFKHGSDSYTSPTEVFLGIKLPQLRTLADSYLRSSTTDLVALSGVLSEVIAEEVHEFKLFGVLALDLLYKHPQKYLPDSSAEDTRAWAHELYMDCLEFYTNWDIIDSSCIRLVGEHLATVEREALEACKTTHSLDVHLPAWFRDLIHSRQFWHVRVAIVSQLGVVSEPELVPVACDILKMILIIVNEKEEFLIGERVFRDKTLLYKPIGWVLRDIRKRNSAQHSNFMSTNLELIGKSGKFKRLLY
ncbi:DNA alkylation repair enzyme [Cladochytrium replicatum]|nr:DNA alkylation repair enzyme [Cladochytrium replicatum]